MRNKAFVPQFLDHGQSIGEGRIFPLLAGFVLNGAHHEAFALHARDQVVEVEHIVVPAICLNRQRYIPRILDLLQIDQELIPGGRRLCNAGLGEDILVIPEHHRAVIIGHQIVNAILGIQIKRAGIENILEGNVLVQSIGGQHIIQREQQAFLHQAAGDLAGILVDEIDHGVGAKSGSNFGLVLATIPDG